MSTEHPRRHPADDGPVDLMEAGGSLLAQAREGGNGHASRLLLGGARQRVVLMALRSGATLSDHESPPAATLQVLQGAARVVAVDGEERLVEAGRLIAIPSARHGVEALEDSILLLTVALAP
jgi:quercetin dioxygenase-like cupin family protein